MQSRRLDAGRQGGRLLAWALVPILGIVVLAPFVLGASAMQTALILLAFLILLVAFYGTNSVGNGLIILAFFTVPWNNVGRIGFVQVSDVLFMLGALLLFHRYLESPVELPRAFSGGALGFTIVALVSGAAVGAGADSWHHTADVFLGVLVVPILVTWWRPSQRLVVLASSAYILGNIVSINSAINQGALNGGRYPGLTTHPNALGTCSALAVALTPFLWAVSARSLNRTLIVIAGLISLVGVYVSGSRAAVVALLILACFHPLLAKSARAAFSLAVLAVPAMIVAAQQAADPSSTGAVGRLFGGGDAAGSSAERVTGTDYGFQLVEHHPILGTGWTEVWGVHNIYLETAAAVGVIGLFLFGLMVFALVRPAWTCAPPYRWLAYPAISAAWIGLVDPAIGARYIWEPVALALCAARLAREDSARAEPEGEDFRTEAPPQYGAKLAR